MRTSAELRLAHDRLGPDLLKRVERSIGHGWLISEGLKPGHLDWRLSTAIDRQTAFQRNLVLGSSGQRRPTVLQRLVTHLGLGTSRRLVMGRDQGQPMGLIAGRVGRLLAGCTNTPIAFEGLGDLGPIDPSIEVHGDRRHGIIGQEVPGTGVFAQVGQDRE